MTSSGRIVFGKLDALNPGDLESRLRRIQLDLISGVPALAVQRSRGRRISRRQLINFCFHLAQLTQAGIPIIEGLRDLRDSLENPALREVLAGVLESIEGGKTLSQALAEHPRMFDRVFTGLIRAGEDTGKLSDVLKGLVESLKWQDELASQTQKLLLYPAFMGSVVLAVTLFMIVYLVPRMVGFITGMGQQLPTHTRILIAVSHLVVDYWYVVLGLPLLLVTGALLLFRWNAGIRYRFDAIKLSLPIFGTIWRKLTLSRFADVFAMMYASGIPVLDALRATEGVVGNRVIRRGLERVAALIAEGRGISAAFEDVGLFPPLAVRMLRVGETTGGLDTALVNVSYFYGRDVRESIARIQTMVEPAMTLLVGFILGWVMLAVFGPIYDAVAGLKM
jgi:type IV pilus assembly protein PilC